MKGQIEPNPVIVMHDAYHHTPVRAVAFDCFGTLLRITTPTNPWRSLRAAARSTPGARLLDPRREPIPTIKLFAAACGVAFQPDWQRDLDIELISIEPMPEALTVVERLHRAGFRIALASNLAPPYIIPALTFLGQFIDVRCFSCNSAVRAVKPEPAFFEALRTRIECPAHEILMVGDSLTSDIEGTKAAGMSALHFVPGDNAPGPGQISRLTDVLSFLNLK